ncbi:phenoloxidase-activating factor 2 [Folsomia candida]|uniref:phenoloxidase-activating factor 2 n=1 Tax=Folsomia candida TaxID=158441 RepID=UPI000B90873B|nr:phenoloxidase-activating factor 2 [Folsomia candida]
MPDDIEIRVGSLRSDEMGTVMAVKKIILHPQFNVDKNMVIFNDVGVIVLDKAVAISSSVGLMSVALRAPADMTRCTISGYGYLTLKGFTAKNQSPANKKLLFVELPIVKKETCGEMIRLPEMTDGVICAGGEAGKGTCDMDSGSPLVCPTANLPNPTMWQVGVVSIGICGEDVPSIFTNLAMYTAWIAEQLLVLS